MTGIMIIELWIELVGASGSQARVRLGHYLKSIEIGSSILDFDFSFLASFVFVFHFLSFLIISP